MDLSSPEPIVQVSGYDRVIAEWPLDPAFLPIGALLVLLAIVIAAALWRHL